MKNKKNIFVNFVFCLIFSYFAIEFILLVVKMFAFQPYGGGDTWTIWNLKAKFLFRDGGIYWQRIFDPVIYWSHPDYPLFLPLVISFGWRIFGGENFLVSIFVAAFFLFSSVAVIFFALAKARGRYVSLLALSVLCSTPFFINHGTSQYADVPLGFLMLLSFVILYFSETACKNNFRIKVILGLVLSLSAWTKNEGMIFSLLFIVIYFMKKIIEKRNVKKSVLFLIMGYLPLFSALIWFKQFSHDDLLNSQTAIQIGQKLLDFQRYRIVISAFISEFFKFPEWRFSLWPFLFLGALFFYRNNSSENKKIIKINLLTMILMFICYYFVFIITPRDLNWHLDTTLNRLYIQMFPSLLFTIFLCFNFSKE